MDVLFAGSSALEVIRLVRRNPDLVLVPAKGFNSVCLDGPRGSASSINFCALGLSTPPTPTHPAFIRVSNKSRRKRIPSVCCLTLPKGLPPGSVLQLKTAGSREGTQQELFDGRRVFVECVPFACTTVASRYQRLIRNGKMTEEDAVVRLVELIMEFSGRYGRDPAQPRNAESLNKISPVSSTEEFRQFALNSHHLFGIGLLSKALLFARDGSRSAMETCIWIMTTMPEQYGGYGFTGAALNTPIVPSDAERSMMGHKTLTPDLLWEKGHVAIEYQGFNDHLSRASRAEDNRRMNDYQICGVMAFFLTFEDVRGAYSFDRLARRIAKAMDLHGANNETARIERLLNDSEASQRRMQRLAQVLPPINR